MYVLSRSGEDGQRRAPWIRTALRLALLWAAAMGLASPTGATTAREYQARVTRVHDGDTVWVKPRDGGRYRKLRLDGLDAPEICQDGGVASRDALAALVLEKTVTVNERTYDDYGRALAHISIAGDDVGSWLVSQGQAWSYRWRNSLGPYEAEESRARTQRKGLFANAQAEIPRSFRKRHGPCQ
jgi:micrococcal nuclease